LAEGVAGEGFAELGHCSQVSGVEFGDFNGFAPLHHGEVREPLLGAPGVVLQCGVVLDDAADDLEEGDAAGERIGHGLEDDNAGGLAVGDFARGSVVLGIGGRVEVLDDVGIALGRRGCVDPQEVEQVVEGHVGQTA
jgi:hypothetical protein